jgi:1-hydroxycarotenoid 3,4-desaturase
MKSQRVVVVGAGIGGLVCALELAARGLDVLVLERAAAPGGKMRQVEVAGARMDAGPTVFTMRWVFEELFDAVGTTLSEHIGMQPVELLARHAWSSHERLDLHADAKRSAEAIGDFAGAQAAAGFLDFCARARRVYQTLEKPYLRSPRPTPVSLAARAGLRGLSDLMRIAPLANLWQALGEHFPDPRLRQLFGRYATYCGSSPYESPATLMLVAHVEQEGVWLLEGGMHRLAEVLANLALRFGATLRYGCHVDEVLVQSGRASGVRLAGGEEVQCRAVVFNGDVAAIAAGQAGQTVTKSVPARAPAAGPRERAPPKDRSLSALTWNLVAHTDGFPLSHHTVFFSRDYRREFDRILKQGLLPDQPTVYVCAQDRDDGGRRGAPTTATGERMLWIVNAPANGDSRPPTDEEIDQCHAATLETLARCGLSVKTEAASTLVTTPADFGRMFPATGGALYGLPSHGWMASFSRPGSRSRLPGLYLAGGSTHPGPGVPMAALSGRQAAASLLADLAQPGRSNRGSIFQSSRAATPGGTSTD